MTNASYTIGGVECTENEFNAERQRRLRCCFIEISAAQILKLLGSTDEIVFCELVADGSLQNIRMILRANADGKVAFGDDVHTVHTVPEGEVPPRIYSSVLGAQIVE